jgi:adenosylcobinamide-GDP ribazoletransferase
MTTSRNRFLLDGLGTAVKTLTAIPWRGRESEDFSSSLPWFPFVGLLLGGLLYGLSLPWKLLPVTPWSAGTAILLAAADVCLTRGLHFDGLADWADSIGGLFQRDKRLAIMKDVSLGTFGGLALILALLAKWAAFERIISCGAGIWLIPVFIISRTMMVELMTTLTYARTGEGMGRPFVTKASARQRVLSHMAAVVLCIPFGPCLLPLFGLGWIETWLFGIRCRHAFGGITGDLLGTADEMVEITLLMTCAFLGDGLSSYTGWGWLFR